MCNAVLTVYVSFLCPFVCCELQKTSIVFYRLRFHQQTRLHGYDWKFFQQICATTESIKSRVLFIICLLCRVLLLLLAHLTIMLFILSFSMVSPSFHTCEKLSFNYTRCMCVRVWVCVCRAAGWSHETGVKLSYTLTIRNRDELAC